MSVVSFQRDRILRSEDAEIKRRVQAWRQGEAERKRTIRARAHRWLERNLSALLFGCALVVAAAALLLAALR